MLAGRDTIKRILERADPRLFLVVGLCSIHDPAAALDYAAASRRSRARSRTPFPRDARLLEKPRTTVGWKGLINDPDLDDPFI